MVMREILLGSPPVDRGVQYNRSFLAALLSAASCDPAVLQGWISRRKE